MKFSNTKAFTLIEVVIIIFLLTVIIVGLFGVANFGLNFSEKTKYDVIGINLAREGMEVVMNVRDTNWLRRAGKKDQCRINANPFQDGGNGECNDEARLQSGRYIISGSQNGFLLEKVGNKLDLTDGVQSSDQVFSLCTKNDQRLECPGQIPSSKQGKYFRAIKIIGLFDKVGSGNALNCPDGATPGCGEENAKELRFCSVVEYLGVTQGKGSVELCSIITNFKR